MNKVGYFDCNTLPESILYFSASELDLYDYHFSPSDIKYYYLYFVVFYVVQTAKVMLMNLCTPCPEKKEAGVFSA